MIMHKDDSKKLFFEMIPVISPVIIGFLIDGGLGYLKPSENAKKILLIVFSVWFFTALLSFLRKKILSYKSDKQSSYAYFNTDYYDIYDMNAVITRVEKIGYLWHVELFIPRYKTLEDFVNGRVKESDKIFKNITGPYCPYDNCELNQNITFMGNYKYTCPQCNYKNKSKKSRTTLKRDTIKILEAEKWKK